MGRENQLGRDPRPRYMNEKVILDIPAQLSSDCNGMRLQVKPEEEQTS